MCLATFIMMILPIFNLATSRKENASESCCNINFLYSLDLLVPKWSELLYSSGISVAPGDAIIGKENWLFLGDKNEKTFTAHRLGSNDADDEAARNIAQATAAWKQWLSARGVKDFRILICPDKSTIYQEYLPVWAAPSKQSATDRLLSYVDSGIYIDSRPALMRAKLQSDIPLYYKTDTHWNSLGAWQGFQVLTGRQGLPDLVWEKLSARQVEVSEVRDIGGGDLARFLRISDSLRDDEPVIKISGLRNWPVSTKQFDYLTGQQMMSNHGLLLKTPQRPLLVISSHALNQKRVLWLRDSFGNAMAPFMAATFSETLQLQYDAADPVLFARLVDTYKPDYVFVTVVERRARVSWFEKTPPEQAALHH